MDFTRHSPKTLDEALTAIVGELTDDERGYIRKNGVAMAHHGYGTALRNGWGLWHDSELAQHFKTVYGLGHADDMSGMILSAVEAKVKGVEFDANTEAERYKKYWREMNIDPLTQQKV